MFVPAAGQPSQPSFQGTTLVIPCHSAGLSAFIGMDLFILNEGLTKLGYYKSPYIVPGVSNDGHSLSSEGEGTLIMPCEVWQHAGMKVTFLMFRSGWAEGKTRKFTDELSNWITASGFSNVVVLTSTINPVRRERESNRQ